MIRIILILSLLAPTAFSQNWHIPDSSKNIRQFDNYDRTKIKVGQESDSSAVNLEWISWPGLDDSTYFRVQVDVGLDPVYTDGDTTFFGSDEFRGRIYNTADGRLEWDFTFASKPGNQFSWTFPIEHNGLTFYYQPELTQEEIDNGDHRPDSVVGSYAVYHSTQKNNAFKTGKAFHPYRPEAWDASGDTVWLNMNIDTVANELTISSTRQWMRNATYPVTFDPIIGADSIGGSTGAVPWMWADHVMVGATGGTVDSYHFYHASGATDRLEGGIYDSTGGSGYPGALLTNGITDSTESSAVEWVTLTFTTDPSISASTKYWIGFMGHQSMTFAYDAASSNDTRTNTGSAWHTWPDPAATDNGYARINSQYITYTEDAGAPAASPRRRKLLTEDI